MADIWEGFDFPTLDPQDNHYTTSKKSEEELSDVEFMDALIRSNMGLENFEDRNALEENTSGIVIPNPDEIDWDDFPVLNE